MNEMPPAGWYPDPAGSPRSRWWDGTIWTEHFTQPAPSAPGMPVMSAAPERRGLGCFGIAIIALAAVGLTVITTQVIATNLNAPSKECGSAVAAASADIDRLYATHPMFTEPYDAIYADGEVTDAEQAQLDAWLADEEAQYAATIEPIYTACDDFEDTYRGARAQGDSGAWGLHGPSVLTDAERKDDFFAWFCGGRMDEPACRVEG